MRYEVHPQNPQKRTLEKIARDISGGEVYILPTDTVYAFVTTFSDKKAIERLYRLKDMPVNKPLSLYCRDFAQASEYIRMDNNQIFRWMKSHLPGPYTLVFDASKNLPHFTLARQKTVGIRIIDNAVIQGLLEILQMPLIGTSVPAEEKYLVYGEELETKYGKLVDGIVDSGPLMQEHSTILDAREFPPLVLRQGKGALE